VQIDLSKMPLLELKAFAYDQMALQEACLQNLRAANQEIARKTQEREAEINAKHAELDARNAALDAKIAERAAANLNGASGEPSAGATGTTGPS
jgi:C4-dicarboxylate-specific signal transduction histidine kinase